MRGKRQEQMISATPKQLIGLRMIAGEISDEEAFWLYVKEDWKSLWKWTKRFVFAAAALAAAAGFYHFVFIA